MPELFSVTTFGVGPSDSEDHLLEAVVAALDLQFGPETPDGISARPSQMSFEASSDRGWATQGWK